MGPKEVDEVEDNNKKVIDKLNQEVQELKRQLRKSEKEKKSALALFELKEKTDQLLKDFPRDEEYCKRLIETHFTRTRSMGK